MSENVSLNKAQRAEIEIKVRAAIDALPQRESIREGDINHWVPAVIDEHGELAMWHVKRAGGFGGSQIGALVRNYMGQRADHDPESSAHNIVEGALLRRVPDEPTGHMQRGIAMEPEHRKWFFRKYGAIRNAEAFAALSSGVGPRSWMRYSPDEVANMMDPRGMSSKVQTWLGDYKSPSKVDHVGGVAFQYVCQLHMGRMVCAHNNVQIDGMILSQFDWQNWVIKDDVIEHNPELEPLIIAAGDHYWDFVMRGDVPPYVRKERLDGAKDLADDLSEEAFRLSRLKALESEIGKHVEKLQESVVAKASKYRFGDSKLVVESNLTLSSVKVFDQDKVRAVLTEEMAAAIPLKKASSSKYDEDRLVARVRETLRDGEKMSAFYAPGKFESEPLYAALLEAGLDADSLMTEQIRVAPTQAVKTETEKFVQREFADLIQSANSSEEVNRGVESDAGHAPRLVVA